MNITVTPGTALLFLWICGVAGLSSPALSLDIELIYMEQQPVRPPTLSSLLKTPSDDGRPGARLGLRDNITTGLFLNQKYSLHEHLLENDGNILGLAREVLGGGPRIVVLNVPAEAARRIADLPEAEDDLLFNAGSMDTDLRDANCRVNLLHTLPSRAMLTDALIQFFVVRKWTQLFLIQGLRPPDRKFADAVRKSAAKFRLTIAYEKEWIADADMRRNAAREVPVFTQDGNYDMIVVADETRDFGQFIQYNSWLPRPVAGTAGLRPVAWSPVVEQWGALQLQSRFEKLAGRPMTGRDYAAWAAVRSVGEAVTRINSSNVSDIHRYLLSDDFALAGFKGAKQSYRAWNGQLRQPIPLVHAEALVALAPFEGFLHQHSELDTLGIDGPESKCVMMLGGKT